MIAGRKLLLADDSAAVQKVVELTFADEGMEVFSVGDGQAALDRLELVTPDVVLADAFMPGLNGYELCRSMKDDRRFAQIPVLLLISSFAPFDEAEAQRAGADDVITKPFQSIRQLVRQVDSLLSEKPAAPGSSGDQTMEELSRFEPDITPIPVQVEHDEPQVTVLVEAAQMETALPHEETGGACAPDIEFQTADTARLEAGVADFHANDSENTLELEPQLDDARVDAPFVDRTPREMKSEIHMNETVSTNGPARPPVSEALLDLDENDFAVSAIADDVVLDLDPETLPAVGNQGQSWNLPPTHEPEPFEVEENAVVEEQAISPEPLDEPVAVSEAHLSAEDAATGPLAYPPAGSNQPELSAEAINAIAQRVIEQMSEKVVREIAWEVVPELSELMIRKKLDQS